MDGRSNGFPWFAIHCRSRREKMVSEALQSQGYEDFLPLHIVKRRWSDRTKELEQPLFPGYLFCRLDFEKRLPVLQVPGVVSIVGFGAAPFPVKQEEVEAVQAVLRSGLHLSRWSGVPIGTPVEIETGPLAGVRGTLVEFKRQQQLVVSVTLLQRSVAVEIDPATARPLGEFSHRSPLAQSARVGGKQMAHSRPSAA